MTFEAAERARAVRILLSAVAVGLVLVLVNCDAIVPRGGWSRRWGPMVPHTTFPADCSLCHTSSDWRELRPDFAYDHEAETGVPLTGAHADAACLRCHNDRGPVAVYVARGCGGCHVDPHRSSLGTDCQRCHDEETWAPTGLIADHARTRFPLVGLHAIAPCEACHVRAPIGEYRGAPVDCHLCHQRSLVGAFPDHAANGWVRECQQCHSPLAWTTATFDHATFPLEGGHAGLDCTQCHAGGRFVGTPNDCFSCHRGDYLTAPDHVEDGYSTDCSRCHDTNTWDD